MTLNELAKLCLKESIAKGWHDGGTPAIDSQIALIHSELSEALEEFRELGDSRALRKIRYRKSDGKPEGFGIELADAVIRLMVLVGTTGVDIDEAILVKRNFNKLRPHRHGGKVI